VNFEPYYRLTAKFLELLTIDPDLCQVCRDFRAEGTCDDCDSRACEYCMNEEEFDPRMGYGCWGRGNGATGPGILCDNCYF